MSFKKAFIIIALTLMLSSCNMNSASDGYTFNSIEMPNTHRQIDIVTYPSEAAFTADVNKRHIIRDGEVFGFSIIRPDQNECEVHIVDPAVRYHPEELGHEITHCLYGNFHRLQQ